MCSGETTWADLEDLMKRFLDGDRFGGEKIGSYGLSKAALIAFTMHMAAKYPNIKVKNKLILYFCLHIIPSCSRHLCPPATFRQI